MSNERNLHRELQTLHFELFITTDEVLDTMD